MILTGKDLVDRFHGLPLSRKVELIRRFALLRPEELRLAEVEQYNRALLHAKDSGQLLALARAIVELEE